MSELNNTMRAVAVRAYGGAGVARVESMPIPEPAFAEVQVSVVASSLNPLDYKARTGELKPFMKAKFPKVVGGDFSGTISALGKDVKGFTVGDEVFGCVDMFTNSHGSHAEFCTVPALALSRKPGNLSHEQAAALPMAGLTAWQALTQQAGLKSGQRLLVIGGSGGVGSLAVQIGKALGAHVTATAGTANTNLLRQLGADVCIDHNTTDYASLFGRFDVVLDCPGTSSFFHARSVLARGGVYITTLPGPGALLGKLFAPLFGQKVGMIVVKYSGSDGEHLANLVSEGKVKPFISRTLTLDEVPEAIESMRLRQRLPGKQVVKIK